MEDGRKNNGGNKNAGRKKLYGKRVQIYFPIEEEVRDKVRELHPDINEKFNKWIEKLLKG
jgi:hypothetical protein